PEAKLTSASRIVRLPFRKITDDELHGTAPGAQRFINPAIYEKEIPPLLEMIKRLGTQEVELQTIGIDEYSFVSMPRELFVEYGLRIKERAHPRRAVVVGLANGSVGYIPTREAF